MISLNLIAGAGVLMAIRFLIRRKYHDTIWVKGLDCTVVALFLLAAVFWAVGGVALKEVF
jgi:hypothetical protein